MRMTRVASINLVHLLHSNFEIQISLFFNMKKLFFFTLLTLGSIGNIPAEIRTGTLPNGFTYYLQTNDTHAGTADFFLAQRVGSVMEREDQRGLAHFIEHLGFNGTEHFPGNTMTQWLESKGVKFGTNLNAHTSTDETVYNISKVPTKNPAIVDSCLLIVLDWCAGQTFLPETIDAERGVIESEWRHRNSASNRMLERALPRLYPGSIYGQRMPIGLMSIINSVSAEGLREFYDTWYHPANQALVIAGDVDIDSLESKIKAIFGSIDRRGQIIETLPPTFPNEKLITVTETDPEQSVNMIQLHFRQSRSTDNLLADLISTMLADRFDYIELEPDCPHSVLSLGETKYLMSREEKSFVMRGVAKPGCAANALKLWYTEFSRALRHGFGEMEFERAKARTIRTLTDKLNNASQTPNTQLARELVRNYLDRTQPIASSDRYRTELIRLGSLTVHDVENYMAGIADTTGRNVVIISYAPKDSLAADLTPQALSEAFHSVNSTSLAPYSYPQPDTTLIKDEPICGNILSVRPYYFPGIREYFLSNGIRVLSWQSDKTPGQICIRGIGSGGLSMNYDECSAPTLKFINAILDKCGIEELSYTSLKRASAGRKINPTIRLTNTEEIIEIATTPDDLADAFRLIYAKATALRLDTLAVQAALSTERNKLIRHTSGPVSAMGDSIHRTVYDRHPLGAKATVETVDAVNLSLAMDVWHDRFQDMADFTFYITGDFNPDSLHHHIERYIASLPTNGRLEKPRDIGYRFPSEDSKQEFTLNMEKPVSIIYNFYHGPSGYTPENVVAALAFGRILKKRLMTELREEKGWTYGIQSHCSVITNMNGDDNPLIMMPVYVKIEPGHENEANEIVDATLRELISNGASQEELSATKAAILKEYHENTDDNLYRLSVMHIMNRDGKDMHTAFADAVNTLNAEFINPATGKSYVSLLPSVRTTLIMRPEP